MFLIPAGALHSGVHQHDGDIVTHGIDHVAGRAGQAFGMLGRGQGLQRAHAAGAGQNLQQFLCVHHDVSLSLGTAAPCFARAKA